MFGDNNASPTLVIFWLDWLALCSIYLPSLSRVPIPPVVTFTILVELSREKLSLPSPERKMTLTFPAAVTQHRLPCLTCSALLSLGCTPKISKSYWKVNSVSYFSVSIRVGPCWRSRKVRLCELAISNWLKEKGPPVKAA